MLPSTQFIQLGTLNVSIFILSLIVQSNYLHVGAPKVFDLDRLTYKIISKVSLVSFQFNCVLNQAMEGAQYSVDRLKYLCSH